MVVSSKYYLFLTGLYFEDPADGGLASRIYRWYLAIYSLLILERICIEWLLTKFMILDRESSDSFNQQQILEKIDIMCKSIKQLELNIDEARALIAKKEKKLASFDVELKISLRKKNRQFRNGHFEFKEPERKTALAQTESNAKI